MKVSITIGKKIVRKMNKVQNLVEKIGDNLEEEAYLDAELLAKKLEFEAEELRMALNQQVDYIETH